MIFTADGITELEKILSQKVKANDPDRANMHARFRNTDLYLQKESDLTRESVDGQNANKSGNKNVVADAEVPITFIQKETALAFFAGQFLSSHPIFPAVSSRANEEASEMLTTLSKRDEQRFGWVGELLSAFDDVLRYNLCATEVRWNSKRAVSVATNPEPGSRGEGTTSSVIYEGNDITRIDPYNLILDRSVDPCKVHSHGSHVGYVERINYIQLKERYAQFNNLYTITKNTRNAFNSNPSESLYYRPILRRERSGETGWGAFWGNNTSIPLDRALGTYEVVTLYTKIIPREYKLNKLPRAGTPQIFKMVWCNNYLIYCEPLTQGHEYLPIICGQLYPGSIQTKSFTEYLQDLQDMSTSMVKGTMASVRRAVGDRALYDPTRIRKADIDSPNPVSKIAVATNNYQQDLSSAYYQIPYQDTVTGTFQSLMGMAFSLAEQTTGQNQSAQGNFIRGNKSVFEFDTIMSNSQARLQLGALWISQLFLNPIKEVLKINYLVHSQNDTIENAQTGEEVTIDAQMLRDVAPDFAMADGIMPSTKLANSEVLVQAIQYIQSNPMLNLEYDVGGLVISLLRQQGLTGLEQYRRTPEEMQQYAAMLQAQAAAQGEEQQEQQGQEQQPQQQ